MQYIYKTIRPNQKAILSRPGRLLPNVPQVSILAEIYLKVPQNRYFNDPRPKPEGHRRLSGFKLVSEMFPVHMPKVHYV